VSTFETGDRVEVADVIVGQGNMASYLPHHGEVVTVVNYWRNGKYIVREDRYRTTVAIEAKHLTKVGVSSDGPAMEQAARARAINDTLAASADAITRMERAIGGLS